MDFKNVKDWGETSDEEIDPKKVGLMWLYDSVSPMEESKQTFSEQAQSSDQMPDEPFIDQNQQDAYNPGPFVPNHSFQGVSNNEFYSNFTEDPNSQNQGFMGIQGQVHHSPTPDNRSSIGYNKTKANSSAPNTSNSSSERRVGKQTK